MKEQIKHYYSELMLMIATIIWGGTFAICKNAFQDISPTLFVTIRFAIASLVFFPLAYKRLKTANIEVIKSGFYLGLMLAAGFIVQTIGLKYTTATKSGFITGSIVVLTPICQIFIMKVKPNFGAWLGVFLVFVGLVFLSSSGNSLSTIITELGSDFNMGDLLTIIGAICYSVYIVYIDIYSNKYDTKILIFMQLIVTALTAFILSLLFNSTGIEHIKFNLTWVLILSLAYTSILATVITTSLQTRFQKAVTPTEAGIVYSFEPILAAVISFFLLGETLSYLGYIGASIMVIGVLITHVWPTKKIEPKS